MEGSGLPVVLRVENEGSENKPKWTYQRKEAKNPYQERRDVRETPRQAGGKFKGGWGTSTKGRGSKKNSRVYRF